MIEFESDLSISHPDVQVAPKPISDFERIMQVAIAMIMSDDPNYSVEKAMSEAKQMIPRE
jgi:hypothetical protein